MEGPASPPNVSRLGENMQQNRARSPLSGASSSWTSNSRGSSYSSASSSITTDVSSHSDGGTTVGSPAMVLRGCPRCFMYVMVQEQKQRCPRCNTSALVRLFDG